MGTATGYYRDTAEELRHHWGGAYAIMICSDGWGAKRRDGRGDWFFANELEEMFAAIRADYTRRPVPRGLEGEAAS